jgi:hypothetical protein
MKAIVTASACAALLCALGSGCYEESFAPTAAAPPPRSAAARTTVVTRPAPQQRPGQTNVQPGVTNLQPPAQSETPAYDTSPSGYETRTRQLLVAAERRVFQLRSFEASAPEPTRSNIEAAAQDIEKNRDKLVADWTRTATMTRDEWTELRPRLDTDIADLTKSLQASSASMNAMPQP